MASVQEQLDQARKDELLDLTLRNSLISHRTLKSRGVEIVDERSRHVYHLLVEEGRKMSFLEASEEEKEKLVGAEDSELVFGQPEETKPEEGGEDGPADRHVDSKLQTPHTSESLQSRLLSTDQHARRSLEEEGVNTLYLALGMLRWYQDASSDKELKAPVLLVPVELSRTDVQGRFRLEYLGEEVGGNLSLKAYLDGSFGIEWPLPPDPEDEGLDIQQYMKETERAIQHKDRWHVDRDGIELGFFSFSRFLMYEDLDVDNWPEGQRPDEHPVLRKLLGDGFEPPESPVSSEENLDKHLDPGDTYHVVDADSSQTEAILEVKRGHNLVLQGPPGTGKSQTITNIIAEAIADGQTVLFASEKMAALEVVKRNLDEVGIGDACLELHSHKTRKKAVLNELERTVDLGKPKVEDFGGKASVLTETRDRLNAYAKAVNEPVGESGVRPYDAYGRLVELRETLGEVSVPSFETEGMAEWSSQEYEQKKLLVERVESHLEEMGVPEDHPFWGSQKTRALPREQEGIKSAAKEGEEALRELLSSAEATAELLGLPVPETPEETERLVRAASRAAEAPDLKGINVEVEVWKTRPGDLSDLVAAGKRRAELKENYGDTLIPEAWDRDVMDVRQGLAKHGEKWYRWFIGEWREAKSELAALCSGELPGGAQERVDLADAILEYQRLGGDISEQETLGEKAFGGAWRGRRSEWDRLLEVAEYLGEVHSEVEEGKLPDGLISALSGPLDRSEAARLAEEAEKRAERLEKAAESLMSEAEIAPSVRFGGEAPTDQPYGDQRHFYQEARRNAPRLQQIVTYNNLSGEVEEEGLLSGLQPLIDRWPGAGDHLASAFERAYYNALLERAFDERPALETFSGAQHEQVAERFRQLDEASLVQNRREVALEHHRQVPKKKGVGQMGVLLNEMGKKSRHMPIRTLMKRAGKAVQAIKPVFMMSPMSVPKYLPPDSIDFDLVIFDEASQVRPVDAFGSILRGEQAVVVGDNKQLPPTSFFESSIESGGEGYEQRAGDQESVLDLFRSRGAPEQMLRFHYRSRHESLIAVSNKEFYDNNLNVFPSPDAGQETTGLVFNHLPDTTYDRGGSRKNKGEAKEVARRVMKHARENPEMTLGVATFSSAQQEAIRERLEHMRREDPSCESFFSGHPSEPFFVKNLESVQGDQRDVMFISVGYGRDDDGKVTMQFGPLNKDGGERRLNVLTTRAKHRCEVFTNLTADDIDLSSSDKRGVEVLKEYLKFAETGELDLANPSGRGADSPFEKAVAERIRDRGYEVVPQVGVAGFYIDLAVKDPKRPGRYLLAIECDGATYHSAKMARVRDRTRQNVLESLGWTLHRIWSTDWFRNPGDELAKVVAAIEQARPGASGEQVGTSVQKETSSHPDDLNSQDEPSRPADTSSEPGSAGHASGGDSSRSAPEDESSVGTAGAEAESAAGEDSQAPKDVTLDDPASKDGRGNGTPESPGGSAPEESPDQIERVATEDSEETVSEPYEPASLLLSRLPDNLHETPAHTAAGWVKQVVLAESPVHQEVVLRRILDASGASRMGNRIRDALESGISYADRNDQIEKRGEVLHDPSQDEVPVRDRSDVEGPARDIEYVPDSEIAECARRVADGAFGVGEDELVQAIGRALGFGRIGSSIEARVRSVIEKMLKSGDLAQSGDHLTLVS